MTRFEDQVGLVTGGASGIGLSIASRLASEGTRLLIVDIDGLMGEKSVTKLSAMGVEAQLEVGDVGKPEVATRSINKAINLWGRIDILINNAGIVGNVGNIWELTVEELDRVYRTNLRGVFSFCRQTIPHMRDANYGRIVNIASVAGKEGNPRMVPYSATKAAVIGLTKSVGKELARTGIRVNCVAPAAVQTKMIEQLTTEQVQYMANLIPMGRLGDPEEIASLAVWLASPECSFSTGAVFDISGGRATY